MAGGRYSPARGAKDYLKGKSFVAHTLELLASHAWRGRSIYAMRLLDALEVEHCRHAGKENGYLVLTWRQMEDAGISKRMISRTIAECEERGLLSVAHRGSYAGGARNNPSLYQLTYLPAKLKPAVGAPYYVPPLDTWRKYEPPPASRKSRSNGSAGKPTNGQQMNQWPDGNIAELRPNRRTAGG